MNQFITQTGETLWRSSEMFRYTLSSGSFSRDVPIEEDFYPYELEEKYSSDYPNMNDVTLSLISTRIRPIIDKIGVIKSSFKMFNQESVFSFINENAHYDNILIDVANNIRNCFNSEIELTLELLDIFEEPEPPKLRITIITKEDIANANKFLRDFRINWFFKKYDPIITRIMFTLGIK